MVSLVIKNMWPGLKKSEKPIYSIYNSMNELIAYVKAVSLRSDMRAVCFPTGMSEKLVHPFRISVLWGAPGYGFKLLNGFSAF
jgi:hypothetical protein